MIVKFNNKQFAKDMNNLMEYSVGFLEGAQKGKRKMLENLGKETIEILKEYIDSNARSNPSALHHVYEWYQVGSPSARLYDIEYTISGLGLSLKSTFSQSTSIKNGSKTPFYDKAKIMEAGIAITIAPRNSKVLVFEKDGETVFTQKPVVVAEPGGDAVQGSYERVFDSFFNNYFTQAFLRVSGIMQNLENPIAYKKNFKAGRIGGRSKGFETGYRWVANVKVGA